MSLLEDVNSNRIETKSKGGKLNLIADIGGTAIKMLLKKKKLLFLISAVILILIYGLFSLILDVISIVS